MQCIFKNGENLLFQKFFFVRVLSTERVGGDSPPPPPKKIAQIAVAKKGVSRVKRALFFKKLAFSFKKRCVPT